MVTPSAQPRPSRTFARRLSALEEALSGITDALERDIFAEALSQRDGLLQALDARVKLVSMLAFLLAVSLARNLVVILSIYILVLVLAFLSAIPWEFLLKRIWLALPFFTGVIAIPALFVTPGPPLLQIFPWLVITRTGATAAAFLLARVGTSVTLSLLLILTTPWNTALRALSVLHVPDVVVLILGMTYRYIYLLLHTANDMFLSRKSRVVGQMSTTENQRMLAAISAVLLSKSLHLSNEVYLAMQSRGFRGSLIGLKPFKMHTRDWLWLVILGGLAAAAIWLGS